MHMVDALISGALEADNITSNVYQQYKSCYYPNTRTHIKEGSYVYLDSGVLAKSIEFILVKIDDGQYFKYVRVEVYKKSLRKVKDYQVFTLPTEEYVVNMTTVQRKVIAYERGENDILCIDFNRPAFTFNFNTLP